MSGKCDPRHIGDPKNALGGVERVYAVARQGFPSELPARVKYWLTGEMPAAS